MPSRETIIVLERDDSTVKRISDAASLIGFPVSLFRSGRDAMRYAVGRQIVAVFADLTLAIESEVAFVHHFRMVHPLTPIVIMSNADDTNGLQTLIRAGVTRYLVRPISTSSIKEAISLAFALDESWIAKAMIAISARLRETRRRLGIRQYEVAIRSGLTPARLSQIERQASIPSVASLIRVCNALGTPLSEIVRGI